MYYLSDICSMCLLRNQNLQCISSKDFDGTVVEEKLRNFLLELIHFRPNITKYVCKNCLNNLNYIYKFRLTCLRNMTILDEYVKELQASELKKSLSGTNEKDPLELVNQNKNKTCENKIQNNCPQDNITVETVFIKDEIEETNNVLHETINIVEESNHSNSQDDIKAEITETRQNVLEDIIVKQEDEVTFDDFSEFNDEKQISDEDENTNSSSISEANDFEIIDKEPPQNALYKCTECEKSYSSASSLKKHSHVHAKDRPLKKPGRRKTSGKREKKVHECEVCHKVFKIASSLKDHLRIHSDERPFQCTFCEKAFKQKQVLNVHISNMHSGKKSQIRSHICDKCGMSFSVKRYLVLHINTVHLNIRNYKCKDCGKGFYKSIDLKNHVRLHSGVKPYKCDICDKSFTWSNSLRLHKRTHRDRSDSACEMENKKHVCVVCQKRFSFAPNLKIHMISHSNERPHECTVCHKTFKLKNNLKDHMVRHTGDRPYMCNVCGLKCYTKNELLTHIRIVHNKIRAFKCEDCNKTFAKANDLVRHSRIHKGIRPFKCTLCDRSFTMANTLKLHGRTHLRKLDDSKPEKEKKFECNVCQKKFSDKRLLRRHGLIHTIVGTPHKCQDCDKSFKFQNYLRQHELKKHPQKLDV